MTRKEAVELLKYHSCSHEDFNNPKWERGFLGMLRPFTGELYESNYIELMQIVDVFKEDLNGDFIDKHIIAGLWNICHFSKAWG